MSKRRYRAIDCKQVDWSRLAEAVADERVILSIDVAKDDFVAAWMLSDPERAVLRVKWRHPEQTRDWLAGVEQVAAGARVVEAAMESSGSYGDALRMQLVQRGIAVHRVGAKRVHDAAEVYDGVPSLHDAKAAEIIGHLHLAGRSEPWQEPAPERRAMNAQLKRLRILKQRWQDDCNRLEGELSRYWPESLRILGQSSLTLQRLIAEYGGPARIHARAAEAAALMQRAGGPGLRQETIDALLNSAAETLGVACFGEEREWLQWLARNLLETHRELRCIERRVEQQVEENALVADLSEVIGKISAAVLWAAQGDPRDYPDAGSYCKSIGLNLKERSSGKHEGQLKITKRGPSVSRFYLYYAALRLIAKDPLVKRWFEIKSRRPGAIKNKTVIELMRKLAKGLWHCARGEVFRTEKLFDLKAVENF